MSGLDGLTPEQRARFLQRVRGQAATTARPFADIPRAGSEPVPLSAEQEQLLFHTYFLRGNPIYNEAVTIVKTGPLDLDAFRAAFRGFVERHRIWRTTFQRIDRRWMQVVGAAPEFPLPLHDLCGLPPDERERAAAKLITELASEPYDLRTGPLVRPLLVRFAVDEHRLLLALHHIVFDGVSLYRVVLPELIALYDAAVAARPSPLPPVVQYADYTLWQRSGVLEDELARYTPYWRDHLAGAPTLNLPLTRPRPEEPRYHGTTEWFVVPRELVDQLRRLGGRTSSTLFHVLVGAYALLLQGYTGDEDVVFATVADLRRRREFESMVGYCLTPMPLRLAVPHDGSFGELVGQVRDELLTGLSRLVPFERLVAELDPAQVAGANPVFQAMLVLEPPSPALHPHWSLHQLDARLGQGLGHAKLDFHMELDQRPEGHISGRFIFNSDVFDPGFGKQVVTDWLDRLRSLTAVSS